jgi:hypothetical protein
MKQYHIDCLHDVGIAAEGEVVSDYSPLTTQEVISLLETAIGLMDHASFDTQRSMGDIMSIQVRLIQAISGMQCPRPIHGPVAERMDALDHAFVAWIKNPDTLFFKEVSLTEDTDIVVTLTSLMQA